MENNGLDDESFPIFIEQLRVRSELASFIFVNNDLGERTIEKIIEVTEELSYLKFSQIRFSNC